MDELLRKKKVLQNFLDNNIGLLSEDETELFIEMLEIIKDRIVNIS